MRVRASTQTIEGVSCRICGNTIRFKKSKKCIVCSALRNIAELSQKRVDSAKRRASHVGRLTDLWNKARKRARAKKLLFTITIDDIFKKYTGRCAQTNEYFDLTCTLAGRANLLTPSLDQIIPGKGYTPENVQIVALFYNCAKGNHSTDEEMLRHIKVNVTNQETVTIEPRKRNRGVQKIGKRFATRIEGVKIKYFDSEEYAARYYDKIIRETTQDTNRLNYPDEDSFTLPEDQPDLLFEVLNDEPVVNVLQQCG